MTALQWFSGLTAFMLVSVALWRMALCQRPTFGMDAFVSWAVYGAVHLIVVMYGTSRLVTALSGPEQYPWVDAIGCAAVAVALTMARKRSWA